MVKVHAGNIVYPCFCDSKDLGVFPAIVHFFCILEGIFLSTVPTKQYEV